MHEGAAGQEKKFDHVITTWFNVRFSDHDLGLDPDWLEHRFQLFDDFCFPAMRGQTSQEFRWLVFFDPATPEPYRSRIEEYAKWACFRPVFVDYWTYEIMHEEVQALRTPGREYLITTRLDNDDALARDYVELLHAQFSGQKFEFVNFQSGLVWYRGKVYEQSHRSSSFANLIEWVDPDDPRGPRTVLSIDHMSIAGSGTVRQLATPPAWMLVVHGRNLMNRAAGIRCSISELQRFSVAPHVIPEHEDALICGIERATGRVRSLVGRLSWRVRHPKERERLIGA
jgi:hypothetical protein